MVFPFRSASSSSSYCCGAQEIVIPPTLMAFVTLALLALAIFGPDTQCRPRAHGSGETNLLKFPSSAGVEALAGTSEFGWEPVFLILAGTRSY